MKYRIFLYAALSFYGSLVWGQSGCTVTTQDHNIKFKFYFNEILFQARINNSGPLWFILDSGASDLIINENLVKELDLPLGDIVDQGYAGIGENRVYETQIKEIRLGINNMECHFTEGIFAGKLSLIEAVMGHRVDGVIGRHLFEKYVIDIDYQENIFSLHDPSNFVYKDNGRIIPLLIHGVPYARATVIMPGNDSVETTFMIDNGSAGELSFTSSFCLENNLPGQMKNSVQSIQTGGGGNAANRIGRINAVIFGGIRINNPTAAVSSDTRGGMSRNDIAGLIGSGILKHFNVIFDYTRARMILEEYKNSYEPMEWDMSGMFIYSKGEKFNQIHIFDVLPGSPADEAGIKPGDQIITVDGLNAGSYSIDELNKIFKREGYLFNLKILRDGKFFDTHIKLRKLI